MPEIEFMGKTFTVDENGFIDDYANWSEEWVLRASTGNKSSSGLL